MLSSKRKKSCRHRNNPDDARFCIYCGKPVGRAAFGRTIRLVTNTVTAHPIKLPSLTLPTIPLPKISGESVAITSIVALTTMLFIFLSLLGLRGGVVLFLIYSITLMFSLLTIVHRLQRRLVPDVLQIIAGMLSLWAVMITPKSFAFTNMLSLIAMACGLLALNCLLAHLFVPQRRP